MKKIGLVIVTYGTNYGTFLQAFATQQAVRSIGFDTEILDINSVIEDVSRARKKYFAKQIFNVSEVKSYSSVLKGMIWERINSRYRDYLSNRRQFFAEFSKEHFCFAPKVDSWEALSEQCRKYDAILVGSDQLWRPANIAGDYYTLNYVPEEINKIAYATSFGLKEIRKNQVRKVPRYRSLSRPGKSKKPAGRPRNRYLIRKKKKHIIQRQQPRKTQRLSGGTGTGIPPRMKKSAGWMP